MRENENAEHLDLLRVSSVLLARAVGAEPVGSADPRACRRLAARIHRLAGAVAEMAADPGDRATRQAAAEHALGARGLSDDEPAQDPVFLVAVVALRVVTVDVMVVAGVDLDEAAAAVRQGTGELRVPAPPRTPRLPFVSERRPRRSS